jgi:hypothetical protein
MLCNTLKTNQNDFYFVIHFIVSSNRCLVSIQFIVCNTIIDTTKKIFFICLNFRRILTCKHFYFSFLPCVLNHVFFDGLTSTPSILSPPFFPSFLSFLLCLSNCYSLPLHFPCPFCHMECCILRRSSSAHLLTISYWPSS